MKQYIIATSLCRLFIPLYVWACPTNLLFAETSDWVYLLVLYQCIQVITLHLQDYLGPRFFLPKGWVFAEIDRWEYHPILPPDDVESGSGSGGKEGEVDCVICFEKIELANGNGNSIAQTDSRRSLEMRKGEKNNTAVAAASNAGAAGVGDVFNGVRRGANRMSYMVSTRAYKL